MVNIKLNWIETIFSFRRNFKIPLSHVRKVTTDAPSLGEMYKGVRHLGTHIPGFYAAGTYFQDDERIFWHALRGKDTLTIHLDDERYDRLILGIDNTHSIIRRIENTKQKQKGNPSS